MAITAPSPAPPESPSRYGSASGFRIMAWSAAPHTARLPPTQKASSTRGARRSRTMTARARVRRARARPTPRRARAAPCPAASPSTERQRARRARAAGRLARLHQPARRSLARELADGRRAPGARPVELGAGHRQEAALAHRPHRLPLGPARRTPTGPAVVVRMRSGSRDATASMLTVPALDGDVLEEVHAAGALDQLVEEAARGRSSSAAAPRRAAAPWAVDRRRAVVAAARARVERGGDRVRGRASWPVSAAEQAADRGPRPRARSVLRRSAGMPSDRSRAATAAFCAEL